MVKALQAFSAVMLGLVLAMVVGIAFMVSVPPSPMTTLVLGVMMGISWLFGGCALFRWFRRIDP